MPRKFEVMEQRHIWPCLELSEEEAVGIEINGRGRWLLAQPHLDSGKEG